MHWQSISTIQEDWFSHSTKYKTRFRRWVRLVIRDTLGSMSIRDSFEDKNLVRWGRETVKKSGV